MVSLVSCASIRSDGSHRYEDKMEDMLYFDTEADPEDFKAYFVNNYGEPEFLDKWNNELLFKEINFKEFERIDIFIGFRKAYSFKNRRQVYAKDSITEYDVSFVFIDNDGNNILADKKDKKRLKEILTEIIKIVEN